MTTLIKISAGRMCRMFGNEPNDLAAGHLECESVDKGSVTHRNRLYDPLQGRWITADPAGYVDGMNLFGFEGSDPLAFLDPSGLDRMLNPPEPTREPGDSGQSSSNAFKAGGYDAP